MPLVRCDLEPLDVVWCLADKPRGMYVYNDFYGYGVTEMVENLVSLPIPGNGLGCR